MPEAGTKKKIPNRETRKAELEHPTGELSWSSHRSQQVIELKQCLHTRNCSSSICELKETCISGSCTIGQITQNLYWSSLGIFFSCLSRNFSLCFQKHLWWFSYLSSYSDLRLKLGQLFLVHSVMSKEQEQVQLNHQNSNKKKSQPIFRALSEVQSGFFKLLEYHPKQCVKQTQIHRALRPNHLSGPAVGRTHI